MNVSDVSAVIVTRGDVDMEPALQPIRDAGIEEIVVWDNSRRVNLGVFGRFEAIHETTRPYVFSQDDDCVCPVRELVDAYTGDGLQINIPDGENGWLSWGSLFPRDLPFQHFRTYLKHYPQDAFFEKWCDVTFAYLAGWTAVDYGHVDLPWFNADNRMFMEGRSHYENQEEMRQRVARIKVPA